MTCLYFTGFGLRDCSGPALNCAAAGDRLAQQEPDIPVPPPETPIEVPPEPGETPAEPPPEIPVQPDEPPPPPEPEIT